MPRTLISRKWSVLLAAATLLALLAPLPGLAPAAEAQTADGVDVALVIDGSGSISSSDFALQKSGIKNALQDPAFFPLDGSKAVGIVQFASNTTRVEVPYTLIEDAGDVADLVAAVDGISQIRGGTNSGDGILAGAQLLSAAVDAGDSVASRTRTVCLSTDGTRNQGISVGSAVSQAQGLANPLDRMAVLAIEDLPFFDAADAEREYGPHVFGGGVLRVVRNSVEYAALLGAGCLGSELDLVAMEVNQVIQDWDNSVDLVRGKRTWVRAFLETPDGSTVASTARLRGSRGGAPLPGSPLAANSPTTTIGDEVANRRGSWNDSVNFSLPGSWTSGQVTLTLEGAAALDCNNTIGAADGNCAVTVDFDDVDTFEVRWVRVGWEDDGGDFHQPGLGTAISESARFRQVFPIDALNYGISELTVPGSSPVETGPDLFDVNERIQTLKFTEGCNFAGCARIYYGILNGAEPVPGVPFVAGMAASFDEFGTQVAPIASGHVEENPFGEGRYTQAHEIAHTLSVFHPSYADLGEFEVAPGFSVGQSGCGALAPAAEPDHPYRLLVPTGPGVGVPFSTIGPVNENLVNDGDPQLDRADMVFGLNTALLPSLAENPTGSPDLARAVINPYLNFALMDYCPGLDPAVGEFSWPSQVNYETLIQRINDRFPSTNASGPVQPIYSPSGVSLVRGLLDLTTDTVTFRPFVGVPTPDPAAPQPDLPPAGDYRLLALDAGGTVVQDTPFAAYVSDPRVLDAVGNAPVPPPRIGFFSVPVTKAFDVAEIVLLRNGVEIGRTAASPSGPEVRVLFPNGGESLAGPTETFEWAASDADGDALTFTVQYSVDGGSSWQTLALDHTSTQLVVDVDELPAATNALYRVLASDGFNTSVDESDGTFIVPNHAPVLSILSPSDGAVFSGLQRMVLEADAFDLEDGILTDGSISWSSDLNGALGTGIAEVRVDTLVEGIHQITATATDSAGATTTETVTVQVFRIAPPTNLPPDCSAAAPSSGVVEPPNHKMHDVTVEGVTDPEDDPVTIEITAIAQDEPLDDVGDGSTEPDGHGVGTAVASLRAERAGGGDGRVYHVSYTATDDKGASCDGVVTVAVPHDQGSEAVDGGPLFDSTG